MISDPIIIEGVPWFRFRVTYRLKGRAGNRRSFTVRSPGFPWVREEVGRMLEDLNAEQPLRHGSASIDYC